jgi:hypothetical protein
MKLSPRVELSAPTNAQIAPISALGSRSSFPALTLTRTSAVSRSELMRGHSRASVLLEAEEPSRRCLMGS